MKTFLSFSCFFFYLILGISQESNTELLDGNPVLENSSLRKGSLYFYWGYNREWYSKSDISFNSPSCHFTLADVRAKDRQSGLGFKNYLYNVTIPQFNVRAGYMLSDHLGISFGYDHMKYVVLQKQLVKINGSIASTPGQLKYAGVYLDEEIKIDSAFLRFEHTNGLNYISADGEYYFEFWHRKKHSQSLGLVAGLSVGLLYPRSDVDVFDVEGVNIFHTAGYGFSGILNLRFQVLKHVFLMAQNRFGEIILNDILVSEGFQAKQHFGFYQTAFMLGINFNLLKSAKSFK
ncbi:MAG: hypothetical protein JNL65_00115 [Saprospiraceae bacterium]|nr:hypothetical protein [Saprospiraceae bacterium]